MASKLQMLPEILKRRGKFTISDAVFINAPDIVMAVMSHMVVARCEHLPMTGRYEYLAYSDLFEEMDDGSEIPEYDVTIKRDGLKMIVTATKIP